MNNLQEAVDLLKRHFYKVIKVNLEDDSYIEIVRSGVEDTDRRNSYSEWINSFAVTDYVHPNDIERFKSFTSLSYIKKRNGVKDYYRKRVYGEWRWVCFEAIPCVEDNHAMIYVRDVNDGRVSGLLLLDELKNQGDRDEVTGVFNYAKYVRVLDDYKRSNSSSAGVVIFTLTGDNDCDIINFAQVLMHVFGADNCFRVDDYRFVAILPNITDRQFSKKMIAYYKGLQECNITGVKQAAMWSDTRDIDISDVITNVESFL